MPVKLYTGRTAIPHQTLKFSGGEIHVRIDQSWARSYYAQGYNIVADVYSADDVMELIMLTDAVRRQFAPAWIELSMPYFPYARQDRVCNPGEALAARVMCDMINAQNYRRVEIWDAHSDVVPGALNNCANLHQSYFVEKLAMSTDRVVLVAPDAGAAKKVSECAKLLGFDMVTAGKTRDTKTGAITGTFLNVPHNDKEDRSFLIVDDICDGGKTFTELAKLLKTHTTGKIMLYVTHGIFSKGLQVFDGLIDEIYCANPFIRSDRVKKVER